MESNEDPAAADSQLASYHVRVNCLHIHLEPGEPHDVIARSARPELIHFRQIDWPDSFFCSHFSYISAKIACWARSSTALKGFNVTERAQGRGRPLEREGCSSTTIGDRYIVGRSGVRRHLSASDIWRSDELFRVQHCFP